MGTGFLIYLFIFWSDENVLELGCDDDWKTL